MKLLRNTRLFMSAAFALMLLALLTIHRPIFAEYQATTSAQSAAPAPLLSKGHAVDWWFVFKLNSGTFPECGGSASRACLFGGDVQENYKTFSQQFVFASSESPALQKGAGCIGDTTVDPLGATFDQVYNGAVNYVIWNDQFYDDPKIKGCSTSCSAPWGHSKGLLAWNNSGEGFVLQVTTPSWPASGSKSFPRKSDGNTLGCVKDNDVLVSQHFFALKLTKDDVIKILKGLQNASVVADPTNRQITNNGGPAEIQQLVAGLGVKSHNQTWTRDVLSSGIVLISKPSALNVPPWQMVSAILGSVSLRTATWWTRPAIPSTTSDTKVSCWDSSLNQPGAVEIATSGEWDKVAIGLQGGPGPNKNHAKIGVSTSGTHPYAIFGDMNQQGALSLKCSSSQNGRGGLFYVVENKILTDSVAALIKGDTAPVPPKIRVQP